MISVWLHSAEVAAHSGALEPQRLEQVVQRYNEMPDDGQRHHPPHTLQLHAPV